MVSVVAAVSAREQPTGCVLGRVLGEQGRGEAGRVVGVLGVRSVD
jgi:hypothetical protein